MKIFLTVIVFLFLTCGKIIAQNTSSEIFHIDSLPARGVLLDKGWTFHPGDNFEWAKTDFNDSGWISLNINQSVGKVATLTKNNMYWLRHIPRDQIRDP